MFLLIRILYFDLVRSLEHYTRRRIYECMDKQWHVYTYVLLAPNVTQAQVEKQLAAFMDKYMGSDMKKFGFQFHTFT